jgi:polar amino acid transport system substrate-binding protein
MAGPASRAVRVTGRPDFAATAARQRSSWETIVMKRLSASRLGSTLLLCAFAALLVLAGPAHSQGTLAQVMSSGKLRVAIIGGNPPYSSLTPSGEPEGYDIEIAKRIAAALNVAPEFITVDIPARVTVLQTGKADITVANFTKTVQRSTSIAFTDPYVVVSLQFLVRADRDDLQTVEDINNPDVVVGITRGGTAEQNVPLAAPNASIARFNNETDILAALDSGQVHVMSQDNLYNAELMKNRPGQYKVLPGLYSYEEIAIGLPAGDFDWWRVLNTWVGQFNASGDNARLFKEWFGYDLPPIQAAY